MSETESWAVSAEEELGICWILDGDVLTELKDGWCVHTYEGGSGLRHKHGENCFFTGVNFIDGCYMCGERPPDEVVGYMRLVRNALALPEGGDHGL